jgi:hypothetical protein
MSAAAGVAQESANAVGPMTGCMRRECWTLRIETFWCIKSRWVEALHYRSPSHI